MKIENCTATIQVSNLERSIKFYTEDLGFEMIKKYGDHYGEVKAHGLLLGLHPTKNKISIGNNMSIGIAVKNFDIEVMSLKEKGINVNVRQDGPVMLASFY